MPLHGTIALAQTDARLGDLRANVERHVERAEEALRAGADLVAFPELSLTGYTVRDLAGELALDPSTDVRLAPLREISRRISVIAGCIEAGPDHGVYNSAICFEGGALRHVHRKVYLPTYGMFEEGRYFSAGRLVEAFDTKIGRIGMLICEDLWHVSLPYLLAMDGAEVIVSLTASPTRLGGEGTESDQRRVNHDHHRTYARLLSLYSVFINRVGVEDGVGFWGGSAVMDPNGQAVVASESFDEALLTAPVDAAVVRRARRGSRHLLDERPEIVLQNLERISRR
ncbi:MAG: hypothetical protein MUE68_01395 [Bacteroidetes bacterium]|jgi:predicted amidohydrolase|nr:hypothetical protein [Bacteroidota bacterium]